MLYGYWTSIPQVSVVMMMLAKMTASATFVMSMVYQNELFPTYIRTTGMGLVFFISRSGRLRSFEDESNFEVNGFC